MRTSLKMHPLTRKDSWHLRIWNETNEQHSGEVWLAGARDITITKFEIEPTETATVDIPKVAGFDSTVIVTIGGCYRCCRIEHSLRILREAGFLLLTVPSLGPDRWLQLEDDKQPSSGPMYKVATQVTGILAAAAVSAALRNAGAPGEVATIAGRFTTMAVDIGVQSFSKNGNTETVSVVDDSERARYFRRLVNIMRTLKHDYLPLIRALKSAKEDYMTPSMESRLRHLLLTLSTPFTTDGMMQFLEGDPKDDSFRLYLFAVGIHLFLLLESWRQSRTEAEQCALRQTLRDYAKIYGEGALVMWESVLEKQVTSAEFNAKTTCCSGSGQTSTLTHGNRKVIKIKDRNSARMRSRCTDILEAYRKDRTRFLKVLYNDPEAWFGQWLRLIQMETPEPMNLEDLVPIQ